MTGGGPADPTTLVVTPPLRRWVDGQHRRPSTGRSGPAPPRVDHPRPSSSRRVERDPGAGSGAVGPVGTDRPRRVPGPGRARHTGPDPVGCLPRRADRHHGPWPQRVVAPQPGRCARAATRGRPAEQLRTSSLRRRAPPAGTRAGSIQDRRHPLHQPCPCHRRRCGAVGPRAPGRPVGGCVHPGHLFAGGGRGGPGAGDRGPAAGRWKQAAAGIAPLARWSSARLGGRGTTAAPDQRMGFRRAGHPSSS